MANVVCKQCGVEFYIKPSHLALGWGKYCSIICRAESQKKGKSFYCSTCGVMTYKSPKEIARSKSQKYFCTKRCQTLWRNSVEFAGENHINWKTRQSAYRKILKRSGRQQICVLCGDNDARVLMVHHYDKNRDNNTLDNLLWLCNNCHYLVHHYPDEQMNLDTKLGKDKMVAVAQLV